MCQFTSHATKLHFPMWSSTCTCAFSYLLFNSFISILYSSSLVWHSFDMNQMLFFTIRQHVSAVLHVSVCVGYCKTERYLNVTKFKRFSKININYTTECCSLVFWIIRKESNWCCDFPLSHIAHILCHLYATWPKLHFSSKFSNYCE